MAMRANRKRPVPQPEDCNDCAALAPRQGTPSTCVKISFQGQMRRFRIPLPISLDTIRQICRHCYGIQGDVALAYQNQTDGQAVGFNSSEELLSALIDDKKVSDSGELLIKSCLRLIVADQSWKKGRDGTLDADLGNEGVGRSISTSSERQVSVDSVGSLSDTSSFFRGQPFFRAGFDGRNDSTNSMDGRQISVDSLGFLNEDDRTLDFMFDDTDFLASVSEMPGGDENGTELVEGEGDRFSFIDLVDPAGTDNSGSGIGSDPFGAGSSGMPSSFPSTNMNSGSDLHFLSPASPTRGGVPVGSGSGSGSGSASGSGSVRARAVPTATQQQQQQQQQQQPGRRGSQQKKIPVAVFKGRGKPTPGASAAKAVPVADGGYSVFNKGQLPQPKLEPPRERETSSSSTGSATKGNGKQEIDMACLMSQTLYRASDDKPVSMASILQGRPVLLHVVRRYGCAICREHARELSLLKPALDNYGVAMIAVGRGMQGLKKWKKGAYWHGDLYYESEAGRVSQALKLTATGNAWGLFSPKVLREVLKTGVGELSKTEGGDYWNLAGTFVFSRDGQVEYEMRQKNFADSPPIEELVNACRRAGGHSGGVAAMGGKK